jgi:hypothetical protein
MGCLSVASSQFHDFVNDNFLIDNAQMEAGNRKTNSFWHFFGQAKFITRTVTPLSAAAVFFLEIKNKMHRPYQLQTTYHRSTKRNCRANNDDHPHHRFALSSRATKKVGTWHAAVMDDRAIPE